MRRRKIPLFKIAWDEADLDSLGAAVRAGSHWTKGDGVEAFEKKLARFLGTKYCVTFNSGTSALHSLMLAHGIGPDDEVIVPSFTFITTAASPLYVAAKPVFAEVEERMLGLDPESVRAKIGPRTRAILTVHYGGGPCRIAELRRLARRHGLLLIEDAAGAFGATAAGRKVGTFGDSAIFSFCQNKIITTGEGGCATTQSKKIYEALKRIRSHGELSSRAGTSNVTLGYNFRMSSLNAALGMSQLKKVHRNIAARRKVARRLADGLSGITRLRLPDAIADPGNTFQLFPIFVEERKRNALARHLLRRGIMSKPYFAPVHLSPYFKSKFGFRKGSLPVTESLARRVLCLPIYPDMTAGDADYIIRAVRSSASLIRG